MKKHLLIFLITTLYPISNVTAQVGYSEYDQVMISLAEEGGSRAKSSDKVRVAVWYFTDTFGKRSELGDYIGRDFSIHFTNVKGLKVLDRDHFEQILSEQELNERGLIDPSSAKRIGMLLAADAIVTGTVDVGLHHLRVRIKIIDAETGLQFAAALRSIPIDSNIGVILEETGFEKQVKDTRDRMNQHEEGNDQRTTNRECENLKTGDYHFKNGTEYGYLIDVTGSNNFKKSFTIEAKQDVSLFDLPEGTYVFKLYRNKIRTTQGPTQTGSFRIARCESISYTISPSKEYNLVNDFYKEIGSPKRE